MADDPTLAQRIKAKHPEYNDIPDAELETRVLAKHPEYGDLPRTKTAAPANAAPAGESWSDLKNNVLPSAGRFIANSAEGLFGMGKLAAKTAQAALSPTPGNIMEAASDPTAQGLASVVKHPLNAASAVGGYVGDRYGGLDKAKHTLITDPVGSLADAASVATLGGGLMEQAPGMIGKIGRAVSVAGELGDPGLLMTKAATAPVVAGAPMAARALNASALKVTPTLRKLNEGVDIPLEAAKAGAVVSRGGATRLGKQVDALENRVGQAVAGSSDVVYPRRAAANLEDLLKEKTAQQRIFPGEAEVVRDRMNTFMGDKAPLSPREAQDLKVALGRRLANRFGSTAEPPVNVEAQQAMRVGLKDSLQEAVPEIGPLNQQLGPMYAVQDAVNDAVARTANNNVVPVRAMWGAAGGGALGGALGGPVPAALGAILPLIMDSPMAKSILAKYGYRAGQAAKPVGDLGQLATRAALLKMMGSGDDNPQP